MAKGYSQKQGTDYYEIFAHEVRFSLILNIWKEMRNLNEKHFSMQDE